KSSPAGCRKRERCDRLTADSPRFDGFLGGHAALVYKTLSADEALVCIALPEVWRWQTRLEQRLETGHGLLTRGWLYSEPAGSLRKSTNEAGGHEPAL